MGIVRHHINRRANRARTIGILGGTFDPPHAGHRYLAQHARRDLPVRTVYLIPNGQPPHRSPPQLSWRKRVQLCRALVGHCRGIVVGEDEPPNVRRWTVDLLVRKAKRTPHYRLLLIVGADAFVHFHQWRDWRKILAVANVAVARRGGVGGVREVDGAGGVSGTLPRIHPQVRRRCRVVRRAADLAGGCGRVFLWYCRPPSISSTQLRKLRKLPKLQQP